MRKLIRTVAVIILTESLFAQTNPTPWNFNTQGNYSFTSLANNAMSLPQSMVIHQMNEKPTTLNSSPISDIPMPLSAPAAVSSTNVKGYNTKGIGIRSAPINASTGYTAGQLGEIIIALNTTSRTNIRLSFLAGTIDEGTGQSADFSLRCQYRLGHTGSWSEIAGNPVEYATVNQEDSVFFGPILLPSNVDNQSEVQVRWIYYYVTGNFTQSGDRSHRGRLDNISVTSSPIVTFPALDDVCNSTPNFTLSTATPSGGNYSGIGISGGVFSPSIAGIGNHTLTYVYTDGFGISNSVTSTIRVTNECPSLTYCNITTKNLSYPLYANTVSGATQYRFRFYRITDNSLVSSISASTRSINLSQVSNLYYGNSYRWTVSVNKGSGFGPESAQNCIINILPPALTVPCGKVVTNFSTPILSTSALRVTYRFTFYDANTNALVAVKTQTTNYLYLNQIPGAAYGKTYKYTIEAGYNNGISNVYTAPSSSLCTVSLGTPITTVPCSKTYTAANAFGAIPPVSGAVNYKYTFYSVATNSQVAVKTFTTNYFYLNQIPGISMGNSYYWTVSVGYNSFNGFVYGSESSQGCMITWGTFQGRFNINSEDDAIIIENNTPIDIYPNPTDGNLNLHLDESAKIEVLDMLGRIVFNESFESGKQNINFSENENGVYFVRITSVNKETLKKIVVSK